MNDRKKTKINNHHSLRLHIKMDSLHDQKREMALAGIDLSLNSPGVVIVHGEHVYCMFIAQRQKHQRMDKKVQTSTGTIHFRSLQPIPGRNRQDPICRMGNTVQLIIHELKNFRPPISHVYIEGYAFNAIGSSLSKLHEIGGILKYELMKLNIEYTIIPPTTLKIFFCGNGRGTKKDMYDKMVSLVHIDILHDVFALKNVGTNIPNPVQDIVDAYALATFSYQT